MRAAGYALDEDAIAAALTPAVKLVFLCTPNNPTGNGSTPRSSSASLTALAEQALVVVDEAYAEFSELPSLIGAARRTARTSSCCARSRRPTRWPARAAARVIAAPTIIELLRRVIPPYAMPTPTSEAVLARARAAAAGSGARARCAPQAERARLALALAGAAGDRPGPSERRQLPAGRVPRRRPASWRRAARRAPAAGLLGFAHSHRGCVRITIGTPDQNDRLLKGLAAP